MSHLDAARSQLDNGGGAEHELPKGTTPVAAGPERAHSSRSGRGWLLCSASLAAIVSCLTVAPVAWADDGPAQSDETSSAPIADKPAEPSEAPDQTGSTPSPETPEEPAPPTASEPAPSPAPPPEAGQNETPPVDPATSPAPGPAPPQQAPSEGAADPAAGEQEPAPAPLPPPTQPSAPPVAEAPPVEPPAVEAPTPLPPPTAAPDTPDPVLETGRPGVPQAASQTNETARTQSGDGAVLRALETITASSSGTAGGASSSDRSQGIEAASGERTGAPAGPPPITRPSEGPVSAPSGPSVGTSTSSSGGSSPVGSVAALLCFLVSAGCLSRILLLSASVWRPTVFSSPLERPG